jgi:hypothetical protein
MIPRIRAILGKLDGFLYRRSIASALALNQRGEARPDGLTLSHMQTRLEIEWYARAIHPWDRSRRLPAAETEQLYAQQCLRDTEAAISRLFDRLPNLDTIDVKVLDRNSGMPILTGTVLRSALETSERLSVGMRLILSGLTFRMSGCGFESLEVAEEHDAGHVAA